MLVELVRRAQEHDPEAFTELVRRFQDAVFATAYQQVLDFDTARDLAQETFVRAYERLSTLREPERFPGWIIRLCRNLALNHLRRAESGALPLEGLEVSAEDPAREVQERDLVTRAFAALPEDNRLALSLALVDGYTCTEIADMLGTSATTIKGRLERAKRKLSQEVLPMLDETLKGKAPDETFTLETVRASLARAEQAMAAQELNAMAAAGQEALDLLARTAEPSEERRELHLQALHSVIYPTFFTDRPRWARAVRELVRELERKGDTGAAADYLDMLVLFDDDLTETEREALRTRSQELLRAAGHLTRLASSFLFAAWRALDRGAFAEGWHALDQARDILVAQPYSVWHACLEASDEFRRLAAEAPAVSRRVAWGAQAYEVSPDGRGNSGDGLPGSVIHSYPARGKLSHGFGLLFWLGWTPEAELGDGYHAELNTFSHTGNPTHTVLWVEGTDHTVEVPAGAFRGCLLLRASVTESPLDASLDTPQRGYNRRNCGEYSCWLAPGTGPVACRHERGDGLVEHALLRAVRTAGEGEEWLPLRAGERWEYAPAEPDPEFDALVVVQVTHCDEDGKCYLGITTVADRHLGGAEETGG